MKNTFVKVLSFVMALMMVVGTFSTLAVFATDCEHANAVAGDVVKATCEEFGYTWYACPDCGESYKDDYTNPTGKHVEVDYYPEGTSANATCTTYGFKAGKKCAECDTVIKAAEMDESKKPLGHSFDKGTLKEATKCDEKTVVEYLCVNCGKSADKCKEADTEFKFATEETYKKYATQVIKEAGSHTWNEYVVVDTPAKACSPVTVERTCKNCSAKETVKTEAKHNYVKKVLGEAGKYCGDILSYEECSICGDRKNVVNNTDKKHNTQKIVTMTADLKDNAKFVEFCNENGYKYLTLAEDAAVSKEPTCSAAGVYVYECKDCHVFYQETKAKADHVIDKYGTVGGESTNDATKDCVTAVEVVGYCANYATCKHKVTIETIAPAKAHKEIKDEANSVEVGCLNSGVSVTKCENCGVRMSEIYTVALGHNYGEAYYSDATGATKVEASALNCENGIYRAQKCGNKNCPVLYKVQTIQEPKVHTGADWSVGSDYKVEPATCMSNTYGYRYCVNNDLCTAKGAKVEGTEVENSKNPDNHIPYDAAKMTELKGKRVDATCSATGTMYYLCSCGAELTKTIDKTAHTKGTVYPKDGKVVLDYRAVQETCFADGQKAGELCTDCGASLKAPETIAKNADKHYVPGTKKLNADKTAWTYDVAEPTKIKEVAATCLKDGYIEYRYDACCDKVTTVATDDKKGEDKHVIDTKVATAPTCTGKGQEAYTICKTCKKILSIDLDACKNGCEDAAHTVIAAKFDKGVLTVADLEFAAKGHDFEHGTKIEEKKAVCVFENDVYVGGENGHSAYTVCADCDATTAYVIYRAHARDVKKFDKKDMTCTTDGFVGGEYCPICVEIKGTYDYNKAHKDVTAPGHKFDENAANFIPVNYNADGSVKDCTAPAYKMTKCTVCGILEVVNGTFKAPNAAHNYQLTINKHDVQTNEDTLDTTKYIGYACWMSGYTSKDCAVCGTPSEDVSLNNQIKHYYYVAGVKTEIDTTCTEIGKYDGVKCALCRLEVVASKDAEEKYASDGWIGADHNYKDEKKNIKKVGDDWVATSCTEYGRYTKFCATCKKEVESKTVAPLNPTLNPLNKDDEIDSKIVKALLENVKATATTDGHIKYVCNLCGETHTYVLEASGVSYNVDTSVSTDATVVASGSKITVTVKASAVALKFNVLTIDLDAAAFKVDDVKLAYDFGENVEVLAGDNKIYVYPANKSTFVTLDGEGKDLLTLTLIANELASGEAVISTKAAEAVIGYKDGVAETKALTDDDDKVKINVAVAGNADGSLLPGTTNVPDININDIQIVMEKYEALVGTDAYDAVADVNHDNKVDTNDVMALRKFVASKDKTALEYVEMIGIDIIKLVEAHKFLRDMDGDNDRDINDAIIVAKAIKNKLADMTYAEYLAGGKTVAQEIDSYIMAN